MEWIDKRRFLLIFKFSPFFVILDEIDLYVAFFSVEINLVHCSGIQKSVLTAVLKERHQKRGEGSTQK